MRSILIKENFLITLNLLLIKKQVNLNHLLYNLLLFYNKI